jgi:hypothetical protein
MRLGRTPQMGFPSMPPSKPKKTNEKEIKNREKSVSAAMATSDGKREKVSGILSPYLIRGCAGDTGSIPRVSRPAVEGATGYPMSAKRLSH